MDYIKEATEFLEQFRDRPQKEKKILVKIIDFAGHLQSKYRDKNGCMCIIHQGQRIDKALCPVHDNLDNSKPKIEPLELWEENKWNMKQIIDKINELIQLHNDSK